MQKTALVTGGNSGIGYATAKLLKEKGYKVTIAGRNREGIEQAAAGLGVSPFVADLGKLEDLRTLAEVFAEDGLDALVNNGALAVFKPLIAVTDEDYDQFFNANIRGPMVLIRNLLPALEKRQGSVCNVSSAIVNNGVPNAALYAATKGAMDAFTRSLALELAPLRIRINAVSPGAIETPMMNKLGIPEELKEILRKEKEEIIPMKRFGLPEEVAEVVLAQLEASYVTGSIWAVDGGVDAY